MTRALTADRRVVWGGHGTAWSLEPGAAGLPGGAAAAREEVRASKDLLEHACFACCVLRAARCWALPAAAGALHATAELLGGDPGSRSI